MNSRPAVFACLALALAHLTAGIAAVAAAGAKPPAASAITLRTGWAQADITPEQPVILTGMQHARVSEGVADPLTATVLAIESVRPGQAPGQLVLVSCDLLSVSECIRAAVRAHLKTELPALKPEAIVMSATHTHTAPYHYTRPRYTEDVPPEREPYGIDLPAMSGQAYVDFAARRIADGIIRAWQIRRPSGLAHGLGHAVVGRNRLTAYKNGKSIMYGRTDRPDFSHVEGYEDHSVHVLATLAPDGTLTGLVVNLAAPSQVGGGGWKVSADFWHETRAELRRRLGGGIFVLGQASAAGDQDTRPAVERAAEERMFRLAGHNRRQAIALRITDTVEEVLPLIRPEVAWDPAFAHTHTLLELPRRIVAEEEVRAAVDASRPHQETYHRLRSEIDQNPSLRSGARWYLPLTSAYRRSRSGESVTRRFEVQKREPNLAVEVHAIRLGDIAFATNPFECYIDYAMQIKGRSPAVQTFVVQLAGPGSYVPTARSIAGGAYGAIPSSTEIGAEGGAALVEWSVASLQVLWEKK